MAPGSKAKVVPMSGAEPIASAEHPEDGQGDIVESLLLAPGIGSNAPETQAEEMKPMDKDDTMARTGGDALHKESAAPALHAAVAVQDDARAAPGKSLADEEPQPAVRKDLLHIWWFRMGLQYTGLSQVVLQLPMYIILLGFLGSVSMSYQASGLRSPVTLSSISWCTNCLLISVPILITALHYAAARHALEVARCITENPNRDVSFWNDDDVSKSKIEGSRLGITAFSLYGLMPIMAVLLFVCAFINAGSSAANSKIRLTLIALGSIAFVLLVAGSIHVMVRGLLRRERDNTQNYVTFSLEPTFIGLLGFQLFFACVAILKELTVPTAPGTNILMGAGSFESDMFSYPTFDVCQASINATYVDRYCTRHESIELPWQQFGGQFHIQCDDGGWGVFISLFAACRTLVGEKVIKGPVGDNLFAQLYVGGLVLIKEHVSSADPTLNVGNCMRKGSWYLSTAILSAIVVAICVPPLAAHSLHSITSDGQTATWFAYLFRLLGGGCLVLSMVCIFVHFVVRKFKEASFKTFFISYKQDDQCDGAVTMLYHHLPGKNHWLDKMARDRSVAGMMKGVADSDVFIAVLSPKYLSSWFCCLELHMAMEKEKPILLVFNGHKLTVREALEIIEPHPELKLLRDKIEILPIHEEIRMIRTCVDGIVESAAKEQNLKGLYGPDRAPVPKTINGHSFEETDTAKLDAMKEKQLADEKAKAPMALLPKAQLAVDSEQEKRIAALEDKLNALFTRTGAYEFTHKMGR